MDQATPTRPAASNVFPYICIGVCLFVAGLIMLCPDCFVEDFGPKYGPRYSYALALSGLGHAVSMIGYLRSRLWGPVLYALVFLLSASYLWVEFELCSGTGLIFNLVMIHYGYRRAVSCQDATEPADGD